MEFWKVSRTFDIREEVKLRKAVCKKPVELSQICKYSANIVGPTEDMKGLTITRCRSCTYTGSKYLTLFYYYYFLKFHIK